MMRTFMCYDKEGKQIKYLKNGKEYNAGYIVSDYKDIKDLMTINIYEKTYYIQEIKWDDKTTRNEDNTFKDTREWKYANTRKHYIHKEWGVR